jgi:hypothetical protein
MSINALLALFRGKERPLFTANSNRKKDFSYLSVLTLML